MTGSAIKHRRVVVTGLGAYCSIANNSESLWRNCIEGITNVQHIPSRWSEFSDYDCQFWSPLPDADTLDSEFTRVERLTLDPCVRLAITTVKEALVNAEYPVYKNNRGGYRVSGYRPG